MNTLVLNSETAHMSIEHLLKQAEGGGVEVRDAEGNVVALVLSPADHQAWTYAEANFDLSRNQAQVREALARREGITTDQLLKKAAAASREAG